MQDSQLELQKHQGYLEQAVLQRTDQLSEINRNLQDEIAEHLKAELELNKGGDVLQAIFVLFERDDLTRTQRLYSIVDALRRYLNYEYVMLSNVTENKFKY